MIGQTLLLLLAAGSAAVSPNGGTLALSSASPTISFTPAGVVGPNASVLGLNSGSPTVSFTPVNVGITPAASSLALSSGQPTISFSSAPAGPSGAGVRRYVAIAVPYDYSSAAT